MRTPNQPSHRIILKKAKAAGWTIQETRQGWRLLAPDGKNAVQIHSSSSDVRAIKNIKRDFRLAGLDLDA